MRYVSIPVATSRRSSGRSDEFRCQFCPVFLSDDDKDDVDVGESCNEAAGHSLCSSSSPEPGYVMAFFLAIAACRSQGAVDVDLRADTGGGRETDTRSPAQTQSQTQLSSCPKKGCLLLLLMLAVGGLSGLFSLVVFLGLPKGNWERKGKLVSCQKQTSRKQLASCVHRGKTKAEVRE